MEDVLSKYPPDEDLIQRMEKEIQASDRENARLLLQEVIDQTNTPSLVCQARMNLGYYQMDDKKYREARREFERVLTMSGNSTTTLSNIYLALAKISTQERNLDEAERLFNLWLEVSSRIDGEGRVTRLGVMATYLEFLNARNEQARGSQVGWFRALASYFPFRHIIMRRADLKVDDCPGQHLNLAKATDRVFELRNINETICSAGDWMTRYYVPLVRRYDDVMRELRHDLEVLSKTEENSKFCNILTEITGDFDQFVETRHP
ncbi:uncharacterized protein CCOS01_16972 [Colletotrichum costaricense]|uniref:Tetratricopeptide repeat protein n=2 Tax=Colletotrichum acutatum species complex TaxID=2707335 RepID=A0AAJ0DRH2_9PEZI|nr:uncharacterized protein CCOS01_16972 [Colletotrichum costaricense]XP_060372850.1 uncharacterized protein CTAM01_16574 [Colletotrichum tamarilloi]KAK1471317.1 hypothetical protein CTAM01_16574 [Colletotrichum tamarilloi]KAK1503897.1 hypothetical protein CCOS01_16972 [Colletotrichum costaricense]